jgi:hypothetical protein
MRALHAFAAATLVGLACLSPAATSLSFDSMNLLQMAVSETRSGHKGEAQACLSCLLMSGGVTIGMEWPGAMSGTVEHAVQVWQSRLDDCPFRYVDGAKADIRVRFVDEIPAGGDVQGQIKVQRTLRWGSHGAGYRLKGWIMVRQNVDGRPLTQPEIAAVVEHELGHLLGLDDDDRVGMLMGPFAAGEPVDGPTIEEVVKVAAFRTAVRRSLSAASVKSSRR